MGRNALVGALLVLLVAAVCALLVVAGAFVIALNEATGWWSPRVLYWVVGGTLSLVGFVLSVILAESRIGKAVCFGLIAAGIVGLFFVALILNHPGIDQNGVVGDAVGSLTIITLVVGLLGIAFRDGGFGLAIGALILGFCGYLVIVVGRVLGDWSPSWLPSWLPSVVDLVVFVGVPVLCFFAIVAAFDESRRGKAVCFGLIAVGVVGLFFAAIRPDIVPFANANGVVGVLVAITCAVGLVGLLVGLLLLLLKGGGFRGGSGSWFSWS